MKLQDTIKIMLKEEIKKDLSPILENLLNKMLVNKNQDIICRVKVKHPDNRTKLPHSDNTYLHYRAGSGWKKEGLNFHINLTNKLRTLLL